MVMAADCKSARTSYGGRFDSYCLHHNLTDYTVKFQHFYTWFKLIADMIT
jgi:hypothetical protein